MKDDLYYLIYGKDLVLPQEIFLPFKSSDKRQKASDHLAKYKLKRIQELHATYEL